MLHEVEEAVERIIKFECQLYPPILQLCLLCCKHFLLEFFSQYPFVDPIRALFFLHFDSFCNLSESVIIFFPTFAILQLLLHGEATNGLN